MQLFLQELTLTTSLRIVWASGKSVYLYDRLSDTTEVLTTDTYNPSQLALAEWKETTYKDYLKSLPLVREKVSLQDFKSEGDNKLYLDLVERSDPDNYESNLYIEYVEVSGLEKIGIPDGKESVTLRYMEPEEVEK